MIIDPSKQVVIQAVDKRFLGFPSLRIPPDLNSLQILQGCLYVIRCQSDSLVPRALSRAMIEDVVNMENIVFTDGIGLKGLRF